MVQRKLPNLPVNQHEAALTRPKVHTILLMNTAGCGAFSLKQTEAQKNGRLGCREDRGEFSFFFKGILTHFLQQKQIAAVSFHEEAKQIGFCVHFFKFTSGNHVILQRGIRSEISLGNIIIYIIQVITNYIPCAVGHSLSDHTVGTAAAVIQTSTAKKNI